MKTRDESEITLKPHRKHPGMFYFRKSNGRWSKDFYNLSRANDYANAERGLSGEAIQIGQLAAFGRIKPTKWDKET